MAPLGEVSDVSARPAPIIAVRPGVAPTIVVAWIVCLVAGFAWYLSSDDGFWFFTGAMACLIVSLPLVQRDYEVLSPWTLVVGAFYLACGLRGLFLSLGVNGSRTLEQLYFLGHGPGYFTRPTLYFLGGLALVTLGYVLGVPHRHRIPRRPWSAAPHMRGEYVLLTVCLTAAVGLVAFLLFAQSTGGLSLTQISAKRTTINDLQLGSGYQSHGEYRVLNTFAQIALWLQVAYYAYRRLPHGPFTARGLWLGLLFVNAVALPVFASSRSDVVYIVAGVVVIEYALGRRARLGRLVMAVVVVAILASALSTLRTADDDRQALSVTSESLVDTFVLTRTFADIPTSGNIMNAVPDRLPYANGSTILAWAVAPIPRTVWPDKPLISSGPVLGTVIFGTSRSGVPPGLIAESYWNFGLLGVLTLPFLAGFALRRVAEYWRPWARSSPSAALMLAGVANPIGIVMMTNSIGSAPFQAVVSLVLLLPVVALTRSEDPAALTGHR